MPTKRAKAYSSSCLQTVSLKIAKINKNSLFWKFGVFSKSSMLIRLKSSSLVLVAIGRMPVPICNRFHERLANNSKITTFIGIQLFDALVRRFS